MTSSAGAPTNSRQIRKANCTKCFRPFSAGRLREQTQNRTVPAFSVRFCVCSPELASHARTVQVARDSISEAAGFSPYVIDHDRNNRPPKLLQFAQPRFVAEHLVSACMPIDALVFGRQANVRPREVDAPQ